MSFSPMSAEHGSIIAAALIPLLSVQVHVVENEGESPKQVTRRWSSETCTVGS